MIKREYPHNINKFDALEQVVQLVQIDEKWY